MEPIEGRFLAMGKEYSPEDAVAEARRTRAVTAAFGLPSIPAKPTVRDARVAIVGFGPSLRQTWGDLRELRRLYGVPAWTVSKAHDYLWDRGIEVFRHTDVDFREHKAGFLKAYRPETEYWLASHVHPAFLARPHRDGARIALYHSVIPDGGPYEPGYKKVDGQMDAGLQAAKLAYDDGFRVQDWFGLDASFAVDGEAHAGPHEGFLRTAEELDVRVAGRVYRTNALLLRQAMWAEKFLREHPKLRATIHGAGMLRPFLQERARVSVR